MTTLTQLRYFQAVVGHGGFTNAAKSLGLSQPTLTRSLQSLEFQLDTVLLDRSGGTLTCTPAGEFLLKRARVLLAEHQSMISDVARLNSRLAAMTYINCSPMAAVALLPRILRHMAQHHPQFPISVRGDNGANYQWKIEALLAGDLDLIITLYDPSLHNDNLLQELLVEPEIRVLVDRSHPLADDPDVSLAKLAGCRWILPPLGSSPRAVVENEFVLQNAAPPANAIEISDWRIALDLMSASDFVIAVPYHPACFGGELNNFVKLPIRFRTRSLALSLMTRAYAEQREATLRCIEAARQVVADYGGVRQDDAA